MRTHIHILCLAMLLSGCGQKEAQKIVAKDFDPPAPGDALNPTRPDVFDLAELAERATNQIATEARLAALEARVKAIEVAAGENAFVSPSPDDKDYAVARTDLGIFLVATQDVVPYLDGFKIRLHILNTTSAKVAGCNFQIRWPGKTKVEQHSETLRPGLWAEVELTITPATLEEVRALKIAILPNAVESSLVKKP